MDRYSPEAIPLFGNPSLNGEAGSVQMALPYAQDLINGNTPRVSPDFGHDKSHSDASTKGGHRPRGQERVGWSCLGRRREKIEYGRQQEGE